ncbi:MAG: hypothetical protein H6528_13420 [Actinobacteria bacterium]|nr:hypothetical protein [Actinomycetota bacterium]MCB8998282.1 hypothetical protein [Actinomycetota bacterium]HRY11167.1 hypothetical protein [Candidatus Nanopelagicales bacterium]
MLTITRAFIGVLAAGLTFAAVPTQAATPTKLPPGSIKHQNSQWWSWFAPRSWTSVDSTNGISITSGNQRLFLDYGASPVLCSAGDSVEASVNAHFAEQRADVRRTLRQSWRRVRIGQSQIRQLPESGYGPLYFRQRLTLSGRTNGRPYGGEVIVDYSLANGPQYCFSRKQARVAPAAGLRQSLRQLRSVQASIAYFAPGVPFETS